MLGLPRFAHSAPAAGLLGLFVLAAPQVLPAADATRDWWCEQHYDASYHVRCVAQPTGAEAATGTIATDRAWWVPLYTLPYDSTNVTVLLESVLCPRPETCRVHYGLNIARGTP